MGIGELFLLAVGLSMDAFAVSVCKGLAMKKATLKAEATCGLWFGGFQMLKLLTEEEFDRQVRPEKMI